MLQLLGFVIIFAIVIGSIGMLFPIFILFLIIYAIYCLYRHLYFKSSKFLEIKESIKENTRECNELNAHIKELKNVYLNFNPTDYGNANYTDISKFKFKRPKLKDVSNSTNICDCSSTVCKNAQQQPFKYICKYFNIKPDEETLQKFEKVLNDFSAAEDGKKILKNERDKIVSNIQVPFLIKKISPKRLDKELGFEEFSFDQYYFPTFEFRYISSGGNSSMKCSVVFDIENLNKFIEYLSNSIKFRKSIAGQRALMTSALREKIKIRDNYTCQNCGLSTKQEPNLLLEIDHIIPLSKNGLTCEDNLQTLCWKCNRTKGTKILEKNK